MKFSISSKDFKKIFAKSQSLQCGCLLFKYIKNSPPQVGFVVSRKYGNAVKRNKFKRRCREILYKKMKEGMQVQVIVMPRKANVQYSEITQSINTFIKEVSIV